ncbi:MAG: DUF2339 domain-containing protein [Chthoniobacterales bacterium]
MEEISAFLLLVGLVLFAVLLLRLNKQSAKLSALQSSVERLATRLAKLETTPREAAPVVKRTEAALAAPPIPTPQFVPAPAPVVRPTATPPPLPPPIPLPEPPRAAIDWEAFLGVKLFAWMGGLVLFLSVVFLVKYSFQNNLVTPRMRVIIGTAIGLALIAVGWFTARRRYRVPGQSLCATGVLVLYASIFGAHAFYNLIPLSTAFTLMSLVTLGAFFLAVKMDAQVVVVLGLIGGFLTPPLLLRDAGNPLLIFGYVALLNFGVAAVALRKRWDYLLILAALGTCLTEFGWLASTDDGAPAVGFLVFLGMQAQFLAFAWLRQRQTPEEKWPAHAAALVGFASLAFGLWLLTSRALSLRPGFFFGFNFLADAGLLALAMMRPNPARIAAAAGSALFLILSAWTGLYLSDALLFWALGAYLLFAILHAGFSVWPARAPDKVFPAGWRSAVPLLSLALLFICVWHGHTSAAIWAVVLVIDMIAVALALASRSVFTLIVALVATLVTAGLWILTAPPLAEVSVGILVVVGGFGVFFATASSFLTRKLGLGPTDQRRNVPALAAAMPFVLLLMVIAKLPTTVPTAVFSVALLLAVVLLGLGIMARTSWIAAVALAFTWAVEREWHTLHFSDTHALLALGWYVAFFLVFTAYPFFSNEERSPLPWAIGALSGVLHFSLIFELIAATYPHLRNGLLPALFVVPYAFGIWYLARKRGIAPASGDARFAWQGGAALLFLSLIFPIQFDREWITLGWALEGFALLALFRFVPNRYLRLVGASLLAVAFVRLAFNPAVFEYHRRSPVRLWNWYLYAYGITCLCLFGGARAVRDFRDDQVSRVVPRLLSTLGTVLAFLLLNIEIADYFSVGPTLTFSFSGNFARDMSYSIAWALFAFVLLLGGMRQKTKWVRYAGVALLLFTLGKLFLHDFANLGPLYRIGAFLAVALILIVASFVYQRFLSPAAEKTADAS